MFADILTACIFRLVFIVLYDRDQVGSKYHLIVLPRISAYSVHIAIVLSGDRITKKQLLSLLCKC